MELKAMMWIQKKSLPENKTRDIIHIDVNGYRLTGFGIYAPEHDKPNTKEQLELAEAIVNKLN